MIGSIESEMIVNGVSLDLPEEVVIPITYQMRDVREPQYRNGDYSKTVELPGTNIIDRLFNHIYEIDCSIQNSGTVNFAPDFNPNLKAEIQLLYRGCPIFTGTLQLQNILIVDGGRRRYRVVMRGRITNIVLKLGDIRLQDFDYSEFDHTYNKATQKASWSATVGENFLYPMITYGFNSASQAVNQGNTWDVNHFFPALPARVYMQKIFQYAGYRWSGNFLDSDFFKHLYIPFNGDGFKLGATEIDSRIFQAATTAPSSGGVTFSGTTVQVVFNNEIQDTGGVYFPTGPNAGKFICIDAGYYNFQSSAEVFITTTSPSTNVQPQIVLRIVKRSGSTTTVLNTSSFIYPLQTSLGSGVQLSTQTLYVGVGNQLIQPGDEVYIELVASQYNFPASAPTGSYAYTINSGAVFNNSVVNSGLVDGDAVVMASAVPQDIRAADFFLAIVRTFGLDVDVDDSQPNTLYIDTDQQFLASGTVYNWTDKLAIDRGVTVSPMGLLNARRYIFRYKQDSDYLNKRYYDSYGEPFGTQTTEVNNDFVTQDNVTEVLFSPTLLVDNQQHDRIISSITYINESGIPQAKRSNLRLLYYGGVFNTAVPWTYTGQFSGTTTETTYPYLGHLDDPAMPTLDLCFGVPKQVYYRAQQYTDACIYNVYHRSYIEEITDKNSKLIGAEFRLTEVDIKKFNFRNRIQIDNSFFRAHRIVEYSPQFGALAKVELLKVKKAVPFTGTTQRVNGAYNETIGSDIIPLVSGFYEPGGNFGGEVLNGGLVRGNDNYISELSGGAVVLASDSARVGNSSARAFIAGSSGTTVMNGATDVTAIGTIGRQITTTGERWLFDRRHDSGYGDRLPFMVTDPSLASVDLSQTVRVVFIDCSLGDQTINLPVPLTDAAGEFYTPRLTLMRLTTSGNSIFVTSPTLINGSSIYTNLTNPYDSIDLVTDGTNYYIVSSMP